MKTIGIRELRQRASEFLRQVERGESIEVTDRGRPIARLVPIPAENPLDRLLGQGRLSEAEGELLALGRALQPPAGSTSASERLAEARRHER